jgi:hypothetical protein
MRYPKNQQVQERSSWFSLIWVAAKLKYNS